MAVIQYTGLVNQIRGKVNGSVLNRSRTVNTVQKKQQPPKGGRGFQSEIRQDFSYAQRIWKDLTPSQQTSWRTAASLNPSRDRFGNQVVLSGYNQFIKARVFASYSFSLFSFDAYPAAAPTKIFEIVSISSPSFYNSVSGGTAFSAYIDDYSIEDASGYGFIFDISLPISSGVTSYHGRWVNVAGSAATDSIVTNIVQDLGVYYPMPVSGQRVLWRARLVHIQTGAVVVAQQGVFTDWGYQPTVESFTVEPSSGLAPYVFTVVINNRESIDGVLYRFRVYYRIGVGNCPIASAINIFDAGITSLLLDTGAYTEPTNIAIGQCFGIKIQVERMADGRIVQESIAYVSNL